MPNLIQANCFSQFRKKISREEKSFLNLRVYNLKRKTERVKANAVYNLTLENKSSESEQKRKNFIKN